MKILIPTIGTRGDVQPFIALAQGLACAGHFVTLASHPVMQTLVESYGVTFAPIGPDIDLGRATADFRNRARNPIIGLIKAMRLGFDLLERCHADILAQCRNADLVVVPTAIAAGKNEAEQLNLPYLSVSFMPWAIPWDDPRRPLFKRITYRALDGLIALITTLPLNRIRKRQGLEPVGAEGFTSPCLNLVPISPAVFAPNPRWALHHHVVGYWFVDEPRAWKPSAEVLTFLESGAPPIAISLGAVGLGRDNTATANLFVDAIRQAGVRAIIQGWDDALKQLTLPPTIHVAGSLPHSWLLPRCAGIVHHGGFGTTSAGFRAGIPALVIPHLVDQFCWGQRVYELGVGLKAIPRAKLDAKGLAIALDDLARATKLRDTASRLGEQIRAENGVENAVRLLEKTFMNNLPGDSE